MRKGDKKRFSLRDLKRNFIVKIMYMIFQVSMTTRLYFNLYLKLK